MAVKVMVARAIANGEIAKSASSARPPRPAGKPRRRPHAIYDAEGNEVFITLVCLKCHKLRPLSQFGLRKMADGAIRNQPWCRACRSARPSADRRRQESAETVDSHAAAASRVAVPERDDAPRSEQPNRKSASLVAAEVAAALAAGMRR